MTDTDRNLWRDRCDDYKREVERIAGELTQLRDGVRAFIEYVDSDHHDLRDPVPWDLLERLRPLVEANGDS